MLTPVCVFMTPHAMPVQLSRVPAADLDPVAAWDAANQLGLRPCVAASARQCTVRRYFGRQTSTLALLHWYVWFHHAPSLPILWTRVRRRAWGL